MAANRKLLHYHDDIELELSLSITGVGKKISNNSDFKQRVADSRDASLEKLQFQRIRREEAKRKLMRKKEIRERKSVMEQRDRKNMISDGLNLGLGLDPNGKNIATLSPKRCNGLPFWFTGSSAEEKYPKGLGSNPNCISPGESSSSNSGAYSVKSVTRLPANVLSVSNRAETEHRPPPGSMEAMWPVSSPIAEFGHSFPKELPAPIIRSNENSTTRKTNIDLNLPIQPTSIPPMPRVKTTVHSRIPSTPILQVTMANHSIPSFMTAVPYIPGSTTAGPPIPMVTTTGPTGRTINGLLYKYSGDEVIIVCVCHGCQLSPSEFVRHSGVNDVSNPLKCITIIPNADA